jgi:hypothetical protein
MHACDARAAVRARRRSTVKWLHRQRLQQIYAYHWDSTGTAVYTRIPDSTTMVLSIYTSIYRIVLNLVHLYRTAVTPVSCERRRKPIYRGGPPEGGIWVTRITITLSIFNFSTWLGGRVRWRLGLPTFWSFFLAEGYMIVKGVLDSTRPGLHNGLRKMRKS